MSRGLDQALGALFGGIEALLLISAAIVILDTYFGKTGALATEPGLGFLKTVSQQLDSSTIGQFLIHTTVPFVLAILGPLLPKDISSALPASLPGLPGLPGSGVPGCPGSVPVPHQVGDPARRQGEPRCCTPGTPSATRLDDDVFASNDLSVSMPKYRMPEQEHEPQARLPGRCATS